jgi:hypothetical protein
MSNHIRSYNKSYETVMTAAEQAIRTLNYRMVSVDKNHGVILFEKGTSIFWHGSVLSLSLMDTIHGKVQVLIRKEYDQQLFAWRDFSKTATKIFQTMEKYLA